MAILAQVLRLGGMPAHWSPWGRGVFKPGASGVIGSGMGPFFNVTGISGGARFQWGTQLNIALKVQGISSQQFQLYGGLNAGEYMAMVSPSSAADPLGLSPHCQIKIL